MHLIGITFPCVYALHKALDLKDDKYLVHQTKSRPVQDATDRQLILVAWFSRSLMAP